jgi:hypothetical protein
MVEVHLAVPEILPFLIVASMCFVWVKSLIELIP